MPFNSSLQTGNGNATITLSGELDAAAAPQFRTDIEQAAAVKPERLILVMSDLTYMASAGLRALIFAKQKMGEQVDIYVIAAQPTVLETIQLTGFDKSCILQDKYEAA